MSKPTPVFYVLYGEDEFTLRAEVQAMRAKMNDPSGLNTTLLDGRTASVGEVIGAGRALPFLADKRLIVVEGMLKRMKGAKGDPAQLIEGLKILPDSTRLVFLEADTLPDSNPILKLALQAGARGFAKAFARPAPGDLPRWITRRVEAYGGRIEPKAASALANAFAGHEEISLYAVDSECLKLIDYAAGAPIDEAAVSALTVYVPEAQIWGIVEALGMAGGNRAMTLLARLLDDPRQQPMPVLAMINRQFRLLIQVREMLDLGRTARDVPDVKSGFQATRLTEQARRFSLEQLESIYRNLLETDHAIKTGRVADRLALDMLVAGLA